MKLVSKISCAALLAALLSSNVMAERIASMVWFGNSYSDAGRIFKNIPKMVNGSYGITEDLTFDSVNEKIRPSCWLDCHESVWPAFDVIDSGHYTYVVPQSNVAYWADNKTGLSEGNTLARWATRAKNAGGVLLIEQMWLPLDVTFPQSTQDYCNVWYDSIAQVTNSLIAPCGLAWWLARQERPNLEYIEPNWNDGRHPGTFSAYLNQCAFYATLTGVSPVGITFKTTNFGSDITLSDADALFAQQKAWEAYQLFYPANRPVISNFTATPSASVSGVQASATFSATVTATNPITSVVLDLASVGGSSNVAVTGSGNSYSYTYSVPGSVPVGPKTVSLRATDNAGNYAIARLRFNVEKPLALKEARAAYNSTKVVVDLSEQLNASTAQNIANYSINNGVTISNAAVGPDSNLVTLTTSQLSPDITYRITINNVSDDAGSIIQASTQDTFQYFVGGDGLLATYWQNENLSGTPETTQVDANIDNPSGFNCKALCCGDWIGIRWTGLIQIPYAGTYTFYLHASHPTKLWINDQLTIDGSSADTLHTGTATLVKGFYPFKMEYASTQGQKFCTVRWSSNTKISKEEVIPQQFFFTSGATQAKPVSISPAIRANTPEFLVKRIDLQGRIISTSVTSSLKKIREPGAGVYFVEIIDRAGGSIVKRGCSVR
jgi:hypothetical protein